MLTAIQVRNSKAKDKPYKLTDGKGLFLHVATSGKKTWRYRFELPPGTESGIVLGEYPVMSLETARIERAAARELVKAGINPADARRQEKQATIEAREAVKKVVENNFETITGLKNTTRRTQFGNQTAQVPCPHSPAISSNSVLPSQ